MGLLPDPCNPIGASGAPSEPVRDRSRMWACDRIVVPDAGYTNTLLASEQANGLQR